MRIAIFLVFIVTGSLAFTHLNTRSYPQDYFRSPVNHSIKLSGTFGELRPNHLHAGIDIKAKDGKIGQPLFAAASGYISRIKVQAGSYGNVLYLSHPNGYTTVYAHLHRFPKEIEEYVFQKQYEKKKFEIELYPKKDRFIFEKGDKIGTLGLSGRSFGPHLHFEIRDSKTEKPINPLLFGIDVVDNRAPKMHELKIYYLNDKRETLKTKKYKLIRKGNNYKISGDTLTLGAWRVGLGVKAYDHFAGVANWNGIYSLSAFENGDLFYDFEMETFSFDETRYINAHLDYEEQVSKKSYFNRCYTLPGNQLSIYNRQRAGGVIELSAHKAKKIKITVADLDDNEATLEFWVKRGEVSPPKSNHYNYILPYNEDNIIDNNSIYLKFPKGAFYEQLYLKYAASFDDSDGIYSAVHHVHDYKTPVHKYFEIAIRSNAIPEHLKSKAFIAYCGKDKKVKNCGGIWKDGLLKTRSRDLGDYSIMVDKVAPKITPISFKSNMRAFKRMSFKIKDNFDTARHVDALHYDAWVDGVWVLMQYDSKKDLLTHNFDGTIGKGEHEFRLVVTDDRGNESVFERTFVR